MFTLPRELAPLALQNKRLIYNLLFHSSAETLLEIARDPRHLGAEIGFFSVLHSWTQRLEFHPHIHCVIAAGGLAPDHSNWISARRDSAHGNKERLMTMAFDEFLRRFLLHLLPPGFVRIRNFGFLANRNRATLLSLCFQRLSGSQKTAASETSPSTNQVHSLWNCPVRGGTCASSNGCPLPNSCHVHHRKQTGVLHEPLFPSSASARASVRTQIPCLTGKLLCLWSFLPPHRVSVRCFAPLFHTRPGGSCTIP